MSDDLDTSRLTSAFEAARLPAASRERMLDEAMERRDTPPATKRMTRWGPWAVTVAVAATLTMAAVPLVTGLWDDGGTGTTAASVDTWVHHTRKPLSTIDPFDRALEVGDRRDVYSVMPGGTMTWIGEGQVLAVDQEALVIGHEWRAIELDVAPLVRLLPVGADSFASIVKVTPVSRRWVEDHPNAVFFANTNGYTTLYTRDLEWSVPDRARMRLEAAAVPPSTARNALVMATAILPES